MKALFTKIQERAKKTIGFPALLFIISVFFSWAGKPNTFYNQIEGKIDKIEEVIRGYNTGRGGGVQLYYEFTVNGYKYEKPAGAHQLKKYNIDKFVGKYAVIQYYDFFRHVCPNIITLTIDGENIITNDAPLSRWIFWLCLMVLSASWLLCHFVRYWKSV